MMNKITQLPNIYPFTRKGELYFKYGFLGKVYFKIEHFFTGSDKPKHIL